MKFAALLISGVYAGDYASEWKDFQSAQGERNGDIPQAFKDNVDTVKAHDAATLGFTLSFTGPFAAMSKDEYKASVLGYKPSSLYGDLPQAGRHVHSGKPAVASIDWVTKGAVTAIKQQGRCGSCWAFSTTGATEGQWEIATAKLQPLSEQQLVDCSKQNSGCQGGLMDTAFDFYESQNIATESSYPYVGTVGSCSSSYSTAIPSGGVTGFKDMASEDDMVDAVSTTGPLSIAIDASADSFQLYSTGVYSACTSSITLDHGVLAVGFGTEDGTDYWKVKNSWGESWGADGYILMTRGTNMCGIAEKASYPTVDASAPPAPPSPAPTPTPTPAPTPSPTPSGCADTQSAFFCNYVVAQGWCGTIGSYCLKSCDCCDDPSKCGSDSEAFTKVRDELDASVEV